MNLRRPHSAASNGCGTLSCCFSLSLFLCRVAVMHVLVLTGFVWVGQLLKCRDRSSPEGQRRLVTCQRTLALHLTQISTRHLLNSIAHQCSYVLQMVNTDCASACRTIGGVFSVGLSSRSCVPPFIRIQNWEQKLHFYSSKLHSPHWTNQEEPPTLQPTLAHNSAHWPTELLTGGFLRYSKNHTSEKHLCLLFTHSGWTDPSGSSSSGEHFFPEQPDKLVHGLCESSHDVHCTNAPRASHPVR